MKNGCFFISAEMLWPFQTEGEQRLLTNVLHRLHLVEGNEEGPTHSGRDTLSPTWEAKVLKKRLRQRLLCKIEMENNEVME